MVGTADPGAKALPRNARRRWLSSGTTEVLDAKALQRVGGAVERTVQKALGAEKRDP